MTERERLIELLKDYHCHPEKTCPNLNSNDDCCNCDYDDMGTCDCFAKEADYLLNNGVVVLPCKQEEVLKVKVYYKHHIKNKYAIVRYDCQRGKPYKIVAYNIQGKELVNNEDLIVYHYLPSMNFTVIADGFDTKEEAEKALERSESK